MTYNIFIYYYYSTSAEKSTFRTQNDTDKANTYSPGFVEEMPERPFYSI